MSDYGVTTEGFVKKRADTIYDEIVAKIKKEMDIDISVNQKSYINVLLWSFIDKIEETWEIIETTYYSMFPSTADGVNLDYVCQLAGVLRKEGTSSKFWILCTGDNGTRIPSKTDSNSSSTNYARIATSAKPVHYLIPCEDGYITTTAFNKCQIAVLTIEYSTDDEPVYYTITLSNTDYEVKAPTEKEIQAILEDMKTFGADTADIIKTIEQYKAGHLAMHEDGDGNWVQDDNYITEYDAGLVTYYDYADDYEDEMNEKFIHELFSRFLTTITAGESKNYSVNIDEASSGEEILNIESTSAYTNSDISFSSNLTTEKVASVILFETEELGEYHFNEGTVNTIINEIDGLDEVSNLPVGIYGSLRETDEELRQLYVNKMALRSCALTGSIQAAVLNNCDGVLSCVCFENDTSETVEHMPPHSIFVVVDGGVEEAIAEQIYYYKPAGIYTWDGTYEDEGGVEHNTEYAVNVEIPTDYNSSIYINFARPQTLYVWVRITLFKDDLTPTPTNLEDLVKEGLQEFAESAQLGETVYLQKAIPLIDEKITGIAYMNIVAYSTIDKNATPDDYTERRIVVEKSQKAEFDTENRLEIVIKDIT